MERQLDVAIHQTGCLIEMESKGNNFIIIIISTTVSLTSRYGTEALLTYLADLLVFLLFNLKNLNMGRMKDLVIDQMNNDRNSPDDTDWNAPEFDSAGFTEADKEPQPEAVQSDGKKLWIIPSSRDGVDYKIWAFSYKQALELLPMIESF